MSETNCNNRLVLPVRWLTIADMEECGEFDLEYLKAFGGNRASKSETIRKQYEQRQNSGQTQWNLKLTIATGYELYSGMNLLG